MAKPNYQYEKRQRELAKKKKKEEKLQRKVSDQRAPGDTAGQDGDATVDSPAGLPGQDAAPAPAGTPGQG